MAIDTIKSTAVLDGAIATADIADDAVTSAKIDSTSTGMTLADLTVDTNVLKVDATNNRVGVVNANPLLPLDITGSNGVPATSGTTQTGSLRLGQTGGNGVLDMGFETTNSVGWIQPTSKDNLATNYSLKLNPNGGSVLMPSQPVFIATADSNITLTNGSYAELTAFSNAVVNIGSHYNTGTGRFTAPVAGTYQFAVASIGNSNADVYRFRPYKNGSSIINYEYRIHTEGGAYGTNGEFCFIVTLAASDYISIFGRSDGGNDAYGDSNYRYSYFRGHLMG